MFVKSPVASLLAATYMASGAVAANSFRHAHLHRRAEANKLEARGGETVIHWVTHTKFVYGDGSSDAQETPAVEALNYIAEPTTTTSDIVPTVTSTSSTRKIPVVQPFTYNEVSSSSTTSDAPATTPQPDYNYVAPAAVTPEPDYNYVAPEVLAVASESSTTTTIAYQAEAVTSSSSTAAAVATFSSQAASSSGSASYSGSTSSSSSSSKRGLAYNDLVLGPFFEKRSFSWAYNWGASATGLPEGTEFVPMLWGNSDYFTKAWSAAADAAIASGSGHLLSFNEPDIGGQADMDVDTAINTHIKYMVPYKSKAKIGSPATSNSNLAKQGNIWLREFITACDANSECHVDFCVTHWYDEASAVERLYSHLEEVHEICGDREIWLTEFAPSGTDEEVVSFITTNLPKLDELSYLGRYSYFYAAVPQMLTSSTALNSVGAAYVA
ncbi:Alkali-sensitive linkage protein 1 [Ceratocystis platani]|uniref:Alkali-sensitive linkage protein 1 n=1 Tax=Ceratocystis fimbriata f. sp. platani TaxID=88771 RepID=A0A0F8AZW7_CERFI|nr:Alkali-sensitive linkage protein 1 [Ceratocystis platani]